jgi:hypothetical protein
MPAQERLTKLGADEAIELLASVPMGRLVFTLGGLPTARPVNHIVDDGAVIIRTHTGSSTLSCAGSIVAYEADALDPDTDSGWSVIVTGKATLVEEPSSIARYAALVRSWIEDEKTYVIRIQAEVVNGFRLREPGIAGRRLEGLATDQPAE